jgi:hypothetical protein
MPISRVSVGKRGANAVERDARGNLGIFIDVVLVVVMDELMIDCLPKNNPGNGREAEIDNDEPLISDRIVADMMLDRRHSLTDGGDLTSETCLGGETRRCDFSLFPGIFENAQGPHEKMSDRFVNWELDEQDIVLTQFEGCDDTNGSG